MILNEFWEDSSGFFDFLILVRSLIPFLKGILYHLFDNY